MAATHFQSILEKRLEEEIQNRMLSLANGEAPDYAHYLESVGYINGLRAAISVCKDIEQDSNR